MLYLFPILILFLFVYIWKRKYGANKIFIERFTMEEEKEIIYKIQENNNEAFNKALKECPVAWELSDEQISQQIDKQSIFCSKLFDSYLNKIADEYRLSGEELLRFKNLAILTKPKTKD